MNDTNTPIQLIAVDDESDAKLLYDYFFRAPVEEGKLELTFISESEDFLKKVVKLRSSKTVVLLDINMPGISGIDLLKKINSQFPEIKVVMVSAYSENSTRRKCLDLGAEDYIEKPVDFDALKSKILSLF